MDAALRAAQWAVGQALAPVKDGLLEAWADGVLETLGASKNLGRNVEDLKMELLLVQVTLEIASGKQLSGPAMGKLLQKLRDSAHDAEDLLDELDYFRIHDGLHGTYDAADEHAEGGVHNLIFNTRHTAKALGKRKLGELLPFSSFAHVHDDDSSKSTKTPKLRFDRVEVSERMKHIIEQLQPVRRDFNTILQSCRDRNTTTALSRPNTTGRSIEPKLYGRDHTVNSIIHYITKSKYRGKDLSVLPIVGPGGIGKTTLMQHIYQNQEVQNHFQLRIWVCVSLNFNLNKIIEEIAKQIPRVEGEKEGTSEELIEWRLKSKRFLLVLDDIWECSNGDDWDRLLLPLKTSQENGSTILVTTRFQAIAQMVKTTNHSIELEGLESEEFRKLFLAFVFGDEQCRRDHIFLLDTGDKIMEKLKGSPLAAKTVGRLLRKDLNLRHWRRVLESKEWERQTGNNDIMPALKLSYDYLPFHLQQCFSYSALFREDYKFRSHELISLWIGLDILQPDAQNQTYEEIGLSNLNELVTHGFFREKEFDREISYVMHDLLHDLALKVASHECLSLHRFNVGLVQSQPCISHLSIIIDDVSHDDAVSGEKFKSELRKLKTKLKVEHLQTLMLFGVGTLIANQSWGGLLAGMHESFISIFGDLFKEAIALRVLHMPNLSCPVESILHNFCALVHLRYLCLGTRSCDKVHLPLTISKFYHLRILDLGSWWSISYDLSKDWTGSCDLPKDMSNLAKLCHFYTQRDELHSDIYNVGKLKLLKELKVFRVKKESVGFEPKQLEHLAELRELGIYNLEKISTKEEAAEAKLMEKNYLQRLTLKWDSNVEPDVEAVVLGSLRPHRNLQELCISGHRGPSCPTWLGDEFAVEALQSLRLIGVFWKVFPSLWKVWDLRELILKHISTLKEFVIEESFCRLIRLKLVGLESFEKWVPRATTHLFPLLQVLIIRDCPKLLELRCPNCIVYPPDQDRNIDWFPKLQELEIDKCPELLVAHIPWTETLCSVKITDIKLLEELDYSKSSDGVELTITGNDDLHSLDQVLAFNNLTELESLTLEKCPLLELKHLVKLTSLKKLIANSSDVVVGPLEGQGDVQWQLPVGSELIELEIEKCPELLFVVHIPWTKTLRSIKIRDVKLLKELNYLKSSDGVELMITGKDDLHSLDQVLALSDLTELEELTLSNCPPLELKHLMMLTSLKTLVARNSDAVVGPLGGQGDVECQLHVEYLAVQDLWGATGRELTELLPYLPRLSELAIIECDKITQLVVGVDLKQTTSATLEVEEDEVAAAEPTLEQEKEEDGVLLLPAHLSDSLRELHIIDCLELALVDPPTLLLDAHNEKTGGGLQALQSLQRLEIVSCPKLLSACSSSSPSCRLFPSSLQDLELRELEGMRTLEPLSNLTSLTQLSMYNCGKDLSCKGLQPLLTTGGQLRELSVLDSPIFFAGLDPRSEVLQDEGEEQQLQLLPPLCSPTLRLRELDTNEATGLLTVPICSLLSSSLTKLSLSDIKEMESFTKEQEDALHLLASLQELKFWCCDKLQHLPAGLHKLTNLKQLEVYCCPAVRSLPKDGLPKSLQKLDVSYCNNQELWQQCRG